MRVLGMAAATALPGAALAQGPAVPLIGVLGTGSRATLEFAVAAFGWRSQHQPRRNTDIITDITVGTVVHTLVFRSGLAPHAPTPMATVASFEPRECVQTALW